MDGELGAIDGEVMGRRHWKVWAVLECSVLNQLSVDSAIARVVDVLFELLACMAGTLGPPIHLVKEAIAIWMAEFSGQVPSRLVHEDVDGAGGRDACRSNEGVPETCHVVEKRRTLLNQQPSGVHVVLL